MSDDKRIDKNERKAIQEIEQICGPLKRVNMSAYKTVENLYNFNDEGFINMLGFDLLSLNLDDSKLKLLGESIRELRHIERILLNCSGNEDIPAWLKELTFIKALVLIDSNLTVIPEFLKEFKQLNALYLLGNHIKTLPDWLVSLDELKIFNLNNRAQTLEPNQSNMEILKNLSQKGIKLSDPTFKLHFYQGVPLDQIKIIQSISWHDDGINRVFSETLGSADDPWKDPRTYDVKLRIYDGKILQMAINDADLNELPHNIGDLKDLKFLSITKTKISSLTDSIGNLTNLNTLILSDNYLEILPESFVNLTSLHKIDLSNNQFKEIPTQLWALKEVIDLILEGNPLSTEENTIIKKVPDLIRDYLRKKATIKVFISHAVIDFEPYRIEDLVNYLQNQKEISSVYFCEEDLAGNIDEWMLNAVQDSQLILFIATNKSVFNSPDCANELQLADKFSIPVIPLKGKDVNWPDLAEKNLSRELGLEYDINNFETFCENLYKYIENFKKEINLMEKEERRLGIIDIYERFRLMLDEKLSDVVRKIDDLTSNMKNISDRIENLEKRV